MLTMHKLLHLSIDGLGIVSKRPDMVQRLISLTEQIGDEVTDDLKTDLEKATSNADFVSKEGSRGYPLLHAFTLVGIWAALEAGVEDMLVGILCNEPAVLTTYAFEKIKIPLTKYEQLDKEERMRFLLSEIQREYTSGLAQGVKAFESALYVFNLSGPVDPAIGDALWKINNLRNVIVHRDSRADRRFVENCPFMNLKIGDRVLVDHETFASLSEHVIRYIVVLIRRIGIRYSAPVPPGIDAIFPLADKQE
jgi:hypothetical protein